MRSDMRHDAVSEPKHRALLTLLGGCACIATAVWGAGCFNFNPSTACSENEDACVEAGSGDAISAEGSVDSSAFDSAGGDGAETSIAEVGADAAADASGDACSATGACTPGSTRVGGVCAIDEVGTETCEAGCVWKTTCTIKKGWRTIASVPAGFVGRRFASTVWTGSKMIVFGGEGKSGLLKDGARYDYATDLWTDVAPPPTTLAARRFHSAVWTGAEMIVWGGEDTGGALADGARYDVGTNTWLAVAASPLAARAQHVAVWSPTQKKMFVWGGRGACSGIVCADGASYDPASNTWAMLPAAPLTARDEHFAAWDGAQVFVWGGNAGDTVFRDGARFLPGTSTWTNLADPPTGLSDRFGAVRDFGAGEFYLWGGEDKVGQYATGLRYVVATGSWTQLAVPPSTLLKARTYAQGWFGEGKLYVWSGYDTGVVEPSGASYDPSANAWIAMPTAGQPSARGYGHVIWTGRAALVWGGQAASVLADGAAFVP